MVAELWISKMGNQVSSNLKHALLLETSKRTSKKQEHHHNKQIIGILSFEVANLMSKTIHIHKSLTDHEISKLKSEISNSQGIKTLVSSDESHLLELALAEKLDDLNRVAGAVSRLGKKCTVPALQGFEHVYGDILSGTIDVKELGFLVRDMESMVRKMERYVNSTASLYGEMEVLNELEQATKKFQANQNEGSRRAFEQKLIWQRQDVKHLKDVSLWNQTYDKAIEFLARSVCTIYARIHLVFGDAMFRQDLASTSFSGKQFFCSNHTNGTQTELGMEQIRPEMNKRELQKNEIKVFRPEDFDFACVLGPGRLFMECLNLSSSSSKLEDVYNGEDDKSSQSLGCIDPNKLKNRAKHRSKFIYPPSRNDEDDESSQISGCFDPKNLKNRSKNGSKIVPPSSTDVEDDKCSQTSGCFDRNKLKNRPKFDPKTKSTIYAPSTTVGGSAFALHYANVIIVIEKLLRYPHLVGEEARDDLYQMLPSTLRKTLKANLKSYVKDLAIYDAPLAHDWRERLEELLKWLAPLAHNMIRWQSERNFEQNQIVARTNVLLLQTIYFADREKTEGAICELLVGLNYICRYEHQQNALLDCASSFDFEDCLDWQLQY